MMAARNSQVAGPKPSFASVAAMAATPPKPQPSMGQDDKGITAGKALPSIQPGVASFGNSSSAQIDRELQASIARLDIKNSSPVGTMPDHEINGILRVGLRLDDERTHLSSSTKPASLDGKSVASGTTFAMDEKESLRPDDSASVKAAEEEDSYSGPASGAPSSRVGSEAGGRAFRDQFSEISERMGPGTNRIVPLSRRNIPGIAEEGPIVPMLPTVPIPTSIPGQDRLSNNGVPFVFQYQEPDEKLIEALESPKDRMFLLHLEQQVITFIKDSQDQVLDLAPCNSFYRLLTHRLGDYYALTHFVDNSVTAVRLWRTPFCRVRTPLSTYAKPSSNADTPPSTQPSMKIMRRVGLGIEGQPNGSGANTTSSSIAASKAGSETGDEGQRGTGMISPSDSINTKDKSTMTREEREAKYKETRDRIFKDFPEDAEAAETATGRQTPNEISRTSSTSGQKKKSKKHKPNDDGFEARSQFNVYYSNMQYPVTTYDQGANPMAFFNPYGTSGTGQNVYQGLPQMYQPYQSSQHLQPYPMPMQQPTMATGVNSYMQPNGVQNMVMYGQQMQVPQMQVQQMPLQQMPVQQLPIPQMPNQYYQPIPQANQMAAQSSTMSSPVLSNGAQLSRPQSQMSDQHWSHTSYPTNYSIIGTGPQHGYQQQNQVQMQVTPPMGSTPTMPYQYGQLPYQPNMPGGRSPHPVPGSYNRSAFNPQTRAFVPGNGFAPQQTPGYPNHLQTQSTRQNFQILNGASYVSPQNMHMQVPPVQQYIPPHSNIAVHTGRKTSGQTTRSQSPGQSSLSKWGTANLPPKPPPPESSQPSIATMQNMTTGQSMPTYQNGTYSKASNGA